MSSFEFKTDVEERSSSKSYFCNFADFVNDVHISEAYFQKQEGGCLLILFAFAVSNLWTNLKFWPKHVQSRNFNLTLNYISFLNLRMFILNNTLELFNQFISIYFKVNRVTQVTYSMGWRSLSSGDRRALTSYSQELLGQSWPNLVSSICRTSRQKILNFMTPYPREM